MDEFLQEFYGTNQSPEDMEKAAAAELLEKVAADNEIDLDDLGEEDLQELYGDALSEVRGEEPEMDKEAEEKFAEADFLGRVMAHSYTSEMDKIAADPEMHGPKKPGLLRSAGRATKRGAKAYGHAMAGGKGSSGWKERVGGAAGQRGKVWGARGGTAAGIGAATYAAHKMRKKSSDADFEGAAVERANEILAESGYLDKTASGEQIERRALEMLEAEGYPVQWGQG